MRKTPLLLKTVTMEFPETIELVVKDFEGSYIDSENCPMARAASDLYPDYHIIAGHHMVMFIREGERYLTALYKFDHKLWDHSIYQEHKRLNKPLTLKLLKDEDFRKRNTNTYDAILSGFRRSGPN